MIQQQPLFKELTAKRGKPPKSFNPATNARMRAIIIEAVDNLPPGSTYTKIREWVRENKRFEMENVGARVRELATDPKFTHFLKILYDKKGGAHVYPLSFEAKQMEEKK